MIVKIKEILNKKLVKYSLLIMSIIGFAVCIVLIQEQIIDFIVGIIEMNILHRKLESPNKWKDYLFGVGYNFTIFFVMVWYYYIKKKRIFSSFFLLISLGIYLYAYKLFAVNYETHRLRFPLFVLLFVIIYVNQSFFYSLIDRLKNVNMRFFKNRILNSSAFIFICGGTLGALFFLYIFGTAILDFTYTDWLMSGSDLSQHYLGWKLFRNSAWHFPLGLTDNIVYPFKISIIYTDSIPLFAIIFKLLSPVLPENFQYFGLFGIICYILQGGTGALIIRKIGGNIWQSIIGAAFFILSTVMMWRIFEHTSLASHFIILLSILAYLQSNSSSIKKQIFMWSFSLALSVTIHIYFIPMVMIFMFFRLLREYTLSKNLKNQCIVFGASFLALLITMFCFGAFYFVSNPASEGGLGISSANINAFVNPQGMSRFLKDMPLVTEWQFEGNAYLGLGIILFAIGIIFQLFQKNKLDMLKIEKQKILPVFGIVFSFLLFSLSPTITFNQYKLLTYSLGPVEYIWSIFRSTGRMIWPVIYIIMTICIWWAITQFSVKKSFLLLSIFLLVQWTDLKPWFVSKGNGFKTKVTWQSELSSPAWDKLAAGYKRIFFMNDPRYVDEHSDEALKTRIYSFLDMAGNFRMTLNDSYLARKNSKLINENRQKETEYLMKNGPRNDTIYVFQNMEQAHFFKETGINFFNIDNVIIGISSKNLP